MKTRGRRRNREKIHHPMSALDDRHPFAETKEQLGGIFVTELPDLDEAIRLAALVPAADYGTLEIRPLATR